MKFLGEVVAVIVIIFIATHTKEFTDFMLYWLNFRN